MLGSCAAIMWGWNYGSALIFGLSLSVARSIAAFVLILVFRYPLQTALIVSASLAQIGEFSFILAELGVRLGMLPEEVRSFILAGALISIAINPLLFKLINPVHTWVKSYPKLLNFFERSNDPLTELPLTTQKEYLVGQMVLVGYGREEAVLLQTEITGKVFFAEGELAKNMGEYALNRFGKLI